MDCDMTDRVTRKPFKNGGSVAVRIPKGWIAEDVEIDILRHDDGTVEIRPLDREARIARLLAYLAEQPELSDSELPLPSRSGETGRFDFEEMFRD